MRKIRVSFIFSMALLLLIPKSTIAGYSYQTGNSWLYMCENYPHKESFKNAACEFYTSGVVEGFYWGYMASQSIEGGSEKQNKPYCFESSHTEKQYIMVIKQFALEHPQILHKPAPWLIHAAMVSAFRCGDE